MELQARCGLRIGIDDVNREQRLPIDKIFPLCYSTARAMIRKCGAEQNVVISPHDFRRHLATYVSRNGVPLEIISKGILRHQDFENHTDLFREGHGCGGLPLDGYPA